MGPFRLYWRYAWINTKGLLQYRLWPVQIFTSLMNTVWDFLAIFVLYWRFGALGEWQVAHTLFAFGLGATSFGLAEWFSRGLDIFPWYIRTGAFDRVLLRPRPTILQALGERFQLDRCGRVIVGIGCIIFAAKLVDMPWTAPGVAMVVLAVAGGWFLYTGVFTIFATISFWTIGPIQLSYMFTNHTLQYLKIPYGFFGPLVRRLLVFVFPMAVFTYFPVMSLAGLSSAYALGFLALPVGAVFSLLGLAFWRFGVRHYHSTGS